MFDLRRLLLVVDVVVLLVDGCRVDVERGFEEHGTDVFEVGTAGPEPGGHSTGWSCRDEVAEGEGLLEELADLKMKMRLK